MCEAVQKKDVWTGTEDIISPSETIYDQHFEIDKLEKEIDRLRTLDEANSQKILILTASHESKFFLSIYVLFI